MSTLLRRNPQWRLEAIDGMLLVSGGADELYVVDEAASGAVPKILSAYLSDACADLLADPECGAAIRQLRRLGALVPDAAADAGQSRECALHWWGDPSPHLEAALGEGGWTVRQEPSRGTLVFFVRTTFTWQEALRDYQAHVPRRPHLLLDLAYHHTISVGPLVVPEQTACIACFGHRLIRRWGDVPLPPEPGVSKSMAAVGALLASTPDLHLTCFEQAVSLDLRRLTTSRSRVFQMPGCEVCRKWFSDSRLERGRIGLPWIDLKRN